MDTYAVIGNPITHSKSPFIHTQFAQQTGRSMRYTTLLAPLDGFERTVTTFHENGGIGLNITVPFKFEAYALATRLTDRARAAHAVNTFRFEQENEILGDNTDGVGLVRDITINLDFALPGKHVLLMGAGGAASGVILPLLQQKPGLLAIANRTPDKAIALQQQFVNHGNITGGHYQDFIGQQFDLIINATSASLHNALPPIPADLFHGTALVYDMLYSSKLTPFLQFASTQGVTNLVDGTGMLVEQAAESFLLWHGIRPETQNVIRQLRDELHLHAS
ncbi:shikimate dehydrogenase [Nitrosomonas eutropha]|uniref:shikimate dehydrogenase n=1 Tax=Nitrosomonas TaxID=914 RepID=UPI0008951E4E|nr:MULTISPECIES: shikimate dehydrogenase [Nitrosomonas]MXS79664.1 shikimate dehydrogenase [Nitrosomonas sp. GH22]SDW24108.1 shikimate dehydrogenase [Nitrosomonas eutropha]